MKVSCEYILKLKHEIKEQCTEVSILTSLIIGDLIDYETQGTTNFGLVISLWVVFFYPKKNNWLFYKIP